jgi:WD40 repeat protein
MTRRVSALILLLLTAAGEASEKGDPLPEFAVARLGTLAFRLNMRYGSGPDHLAFSGDGATLMGCCEKGLSLWDSSTGKRVIWFPPHFSARSAAITSDGKWLVTCRTPEPPKPFQPQRWLVERWEIGTGKQLREIEIKRAATIRFSSAPSLSAEGDFLLDPGDKQLTIWDARSGKVHALIPQKVNHGAPIALSRDGKTLAFATAAQRTGENEVLLYDLPEGKVRCRIAREGGGHYLPEFSPDGKLLVTSARESLCLWDVVTGKLVREIPKLSGRVAISADAKVLACADSRGVSLCSFPDGAEVRRIEELRGFIHALALSADGKRLACGQDQVVTLWNVATGKQEPPPSSHQAPICALAFSADGRTLASGSDGDGLACVWDVPTGAPKMRLTGHSRAVASVAFSADGKMLACGDGSPNYQTGGGLTHIRLWNLDSGKSIRTFPAHLGGVKSLAFAPDGKALISGGVDGRVRLWNVADGNRLAQERGGEGLHWGQFSRDGKSLLVADASGALSLWRPDLQQKLHDLLPPPEETTSLGLAAFSADGEQVFAVTTGRGLDRSKRFLSWQTAGGKSLQTVVLDKLLFPVERGMPVGIALPGHPSFTTRECALSSDGKLVATLGHPVGSAIELWDTASWKSLARLDSRAWYVTALAFSPDGTKLASGSLDTTILLWDVRKAVAKGDKARQPPEK